MNSIEPNNVRTFLKQFKPYIGHYYVSIHYIIMLICGLVLLIDHSLFHLTILLNIVCLDALAITVCHDCPLTKLEHKYLKKSIVSSNKKMLKNAGICFKCNHTYETTFEFLVNMASMTILKIGFLIIRGYFIVQQ